MCGRRFQQRVGARAEDRHVVSFGNLDDQGFVAPFLAEVLLQFLAELRDLDADQCIVAGILAGRAAENVHADVLLP